MFIILSLIVVVAAFNIISGLTILIKNKTKEIAILKTLGLSEKSIKKSFSYWIIHRFSSNNYRNFVGDNFFHQYRKIKNNFIFCF